jgi:hypothetical protein
MSGRVVLPPDQYVASLARKRMAAGALFRDEAGGVLAVDWVPSRPGRPEGLVVVYDGGILSATEAKEIVLADGELEEFAFVAPGEVADLVTPLLARRIAASLAAVESGTAAALENGSPFA